MRRRPPTILPCRQTAITPVRCCFSVHAAFEFAIGWLLLPFCHGYNIAHRRLIHAAMPSLMMPAILCLPFYYCSTLRRSDVHAAIVAPPRRQQRKSAWPTIAARYCHAVHSAEEPTAVATMFAIVFGSLSPPPSSLFFTLTQTSVEAMVRGGGTVCPRASLRRVRSARRPRNQTDPTPWRCDDYAIRFHINPHATLRPRRYFGAMKKQRERGKRCVVRCASSAKRERKKEYEERWSSARKAASLKAC